MSPAKGVFGAWILLLRASWWSKPSGKDGKEGWLALGRRSDPSLLGKSPVAFSSMGVCQTNSDPCSHAFYLTHPFFPLSASAPGYHLIG